MINLSHLFMFGPDKYFRVDSNLATVASIGGALGTPEMRLYERTQTNTPIVLLRTAPMEL